MTPAKYEILVKKDGSYRLTIHGAIKYDDLTFAEVIAKIKEFENEYTEEENNDNGRSQS